jgi:hypothetical protein
MPGTPAVLPETPEPRDDLIELLEFLTEGTMFQELT